MKIKDIITENKPTMTGVSKGLSWSSLDEGLSIEDKMIIFEEYAIKGNLSESVNPDKKNYFMSLSKMSDAPIKNKKYIVVPLSVISNKIMILDKPEVMKFIEKNQDSLVFDRSGTKKTYPSKTIREQAVYNTFTFATEDAYNKFRTTVSLKFDTNLPACQIKTNEDVAEDKWSRIGFSVRSDILWPTEIFESSSPQESQDFSSWLEEQRQNQPIPDKGSECILAMIVHTGKSIHVIYGTARYVGQTDTEYILRISSGTHKYSKNNQIVFATHPNFSVFLTTLTLKFEQPEIKQMPVKETYTPHTRINNIEETGKKWEVHRTGEQATDTIQEAGKKDACYRKVKSRYKVWPSAYASGALVQCRKVGAANWGKKSKKK